MRRRGLLAFLAVLVTTACAPASQPTASPSTTIVGRITDSGIEVNMSSAPWPSSVEFTNAGSETCSLMVLVTEIPAHALPLYPDGTLNLEGTPELPGLGYGSFIDSGDTIAPGVTHRWLEPAMDAPGAYLLGPRIFVCNDPGAYEAGLYAVVDIVPPVGEPPPGI